MNPIGGWLLAAIDVVFVGALALAMVWASMSRRYPSGRVAPSAKSLKPSEEPRRTGRYGRWQDWTILVLAVWLCVSPLVVGPSTSTNQGPLSNTIIVGVLLGALALAAVYRLEAPQEWAVIVAAIWVFVSPWLLGFTEDAAAAWNHWGVAALAAALAVWELRALRHMQAMRTDSHTERFH
ncbi:MAG TPA: SPW repeat protein [Alphaproteobacteria bacterium]|nr:SPW repeat protein [Alphaproteobacteria bacterium]